MAIQWHALQSSDQIERIKKRSYEVPCIIFKHSTRCNISAIAKYRLEDDWDFKPDEVEAYYLDVIDARPVSLQVADVFQVQHESPQMLAIKAGECVYDASHLDIQVGELREGLQEVHPLSNK